MEAVLAVAIGCAALVRLVGLGRDDLWIDEAYTLAIVQRGFGGMLELFTRDANGILYEIAVFPIALVSDSLDALRLPAAVAGILAVPAIYWTGRQLVGTWPAAAAALLMAVSPMAVTHSQDARPIIFVVTLGTLSLGCLFRALRSSGARWWILYALATAAVFYSNLASGLLLLAPHVYHVLVVERRATRHWALALARTGLLLLPLAVLTALERSKRDPLYWLTRPDAGDLAAALRTVAGGRPALVLIVAGLAAAAWLGARRGARAGAVLRSPVATLAVWALAPLVGLWTISQAVPLFQPRYAIGAVPGLCLLVGAAAARLPRPAGLCLVAALLATSAYQLGVQSGETAAQWSGATRALAEARRPGDPLIVDPFSGLLTAGYYDPALAARDGALIVSEWHDRPVPRGVVLLDDPGGYGDVPAGPPSVAQVARLSGLTGRVHLLLSDTVGQGDVWESPGLRWARRACEVTRRRFEAVDVVSVERCRSS